MGIQTIHQARHLFHEHCGATPAPMSRLRIAAEIRQPSSWEQSPGSGPAERGEREPLVRATIGISAPFRLGAGGGTHAPSTGLASWGPSATAGRRRARTRDGAAVEKRHGAGLRGLATSLAPARPDLRWAHWQAVWGGAARDLRAVGRPERKCRVHELRRFSLDPFQNRKRLKSTRAMLKLRRPAPSGPPPAAVHPLRRFPLAI